jgi:hypothetical protein
MDEEIADASEKLAAALGLRGSVGVDYLVSGDEMIFMEVNTRLQDTFECVERYRGTNLIGEHLQALEGSVRKYCEQRGFFGKGILYAKEDMLVGDLRTCDGLGDVPMPGSLIRGGEPVCSIYGSGKDSSSTLSSLVSKATALFPGF